jgi:hypothetical protein
VQIRRQDFPPITKTFIAKADALSWSREQERLLDKDDWQCRILPYFDGPYKTVVGIFCKKSLGF